MRRAGLLALILAAPAAQAADLPVRSITLSSAGLAQVERAGPVAADDAALTFRVPLADVDDILRSLVVDDPAGRVEGLRLPAQDLTAEAFRGLPVRPADFETRAALLNALRGQRVAAGDAEGRIAEAAEAANGLRLTILTATGLRSVLLREEAEARLLDADLAARIAGAAEALAETRSADTRRLSIALRAGAGETREVALTYVAGAPLWKPSWRIAVPGVGEEGAEARLMGWAVVENHSGSDWNGVGLSLVSGEAAAFRQAIYTPILLPRRELPILGSGQVAVRPDSGGRPPPPLAPPPAMAPAMRTAGPAGAASVPAPVAVIEAAPPAAEVIAAASLGRVAFSLADPVTIRAGETANLPFLDTRLAAERVWWVQDLAAPNPLQAVLLLNGTPYPLPAGLATVYGSAGAEAGDFLGDAELPATPAGESRLLAFARDQGVQYSVARRDRSMPAAIALRRGQVAVTLQLVHTLAMTVDTGTARGRLVVDVPARPGETPRFTPQAEGAFGLRVGTHLRGGPVDLQWEWERSQSQSIPLWDAALAEPLPEAWRDLSPERDLGRLPGGTDRLAALRSLLERLPAAASGRDDLAALVEDLAAARGLMDRFRTAARAHAAAEAALARARQAVEDRSGAAREAARVALNTASLAVTQTGAEADRAWGAWRDAAQKVVARGG
jgi:hypothetical protein